MEKFLNFSKKYFRSFGKLWQDFVRFFAKCNVWFALFVFFLRARFLPHFVFFTQAAKNAPLRKLQNCFHYTSRKNAFITQAAKVLSSHKLQKCFHYISPKKPTLRYGRSALVRRRRHGKFYISGKCTSRYPCRRCGYGRYR